MSDETLAATIEDTANVTLDAVSDIPVNVSVVLGKTSMQVNQLLKLGRGAVIELERKVGEPLDIFVNNRLVARGEVVVVEDRLDHAAVEKQALDRLAAVADAFIGRRTVDEKTRPVDVLGTETVPGDGTRATTAGGGGGKQIW